MAIASLLMNPRTRRILWIALCIALLGGLVLCGPAHHALHAGDARGDSIACDACGLSSLEAPQAIAIATHVSFVRDALPLAPAEAPVRVPLVHRAPRGPPACALGGARA